MLSRQGLTAGRPNIQSGGAPDKRQPIALGEAQHTSVLGSVSLCRGPYSYGGQAGQDRKLFTCCANYVEKYVKTADSIAYSPGK